MPQADPGSFPKDAAETFPIGFDFSERAQGEVGFPEGDDVASETVKAFDSDGVDVTATVIDGAKTSHSGRQVQVWPKAGAAQETYKIVVEAVSAAGRKLRLWAKMHVEE